MMCSCSLSAVTLVTGGDPPTRHEAMNAGHVTYGYMDGNDTYGNPTSPSLHKPKQDASNGTTRYPKDMGYGAQCQLRFRELAPVYNWTHHDFWCMCFKNCQDGVLSKEDEEARARAQDELREARLRDNIVEYACIAVMLSLICIVGFLGKSLICKPVF